MVAMTTVEETLCSALVVRSILWQVYLLSGLLDLIRIMHIGVSSSVVAHDARLFAHIAKVSR